MCSGCSQKYRGLSGSRARKDLTRYRRVRGGKREAIPPSEIKKPETESPVSVEDKKENS